MERMYYIGVDAHCASSDLAIVTQAGRLTGRDGCLTTIPELAERVAKVRKPRQVIIEEGPLAAWIFRNLTALGETVIVCDPRRNALISKDGDKSDPIDAAKLAQLARGGYLRPVHHSESDKRQMFKQLVAAYHDRVRNRVRQANQILAGFRQWGIFAHEREIADPDKRQALLARLPADRLIRETFEILLAGYDPAREQQDQLQRRLIRRARQEEVIRRFVAVPGFGWIRAATFYAYIDTPWRFRRKSALWKYLGIGLDRRQSKGGGEGPVYLRVTRNANRVLKNVILGAALSAVVSGDNPFADAYGRWREREIAPRNARRNVARSQAAVLWGLWKTGEVYRPELVGPANCRSPATRLVCP